MYKIESNYRIEWIDTAKLIGIYLVILGHLLPPDETGASSFLTDLIFSFHMPLFFFLSGLVEKPRKIKELLIKSVKNLIVPYVCFYLISYFWWFYASFLRHPELFERNVSVAVVKPFFGMLLGCGFDTNFSTMVNRPLWFLIALFWCRLLNSFTNFNTKIIKPILSCLCIFISLFLWKTDKFLPFSIGSACMAFPFYTLGTYFSRKIIQPKKLNKFLVLLVVMLSFVLLLILTKCNGRVDVNCISYGKNPIFFWLTSISGICLICFLCFHLFTLHMFGRFLAQNTISILALHSILNGITFRLYSCIGGGKTPFKEIIIALLVLVISAVPCYVLSRYAPFILGKKLKYENRKK